MIVTRLTFGAVVLAVIVALAAPAVGASDIGKPSRQPDRIVLNAAANTSNAQIISWRTRLKTTSGAVQIRIGNGKVRTVKQRATATTAPSKKSYRARHHSATVTKLRANTSYRYRVGKSGAWSKWRTFRTGSSSPNWTMLSFADVQLGSKSWLTTVFNRAFTKAPRASAVIQLGDLVEDPRNDNYWGTVFESFRGRLAKLDLLLTPGNHDQCRLKRCVKPSSRSFFAHFDFARNGVKDQRQDWYYTDINNARVISLNSFVRRDTQRVFLDRALRTSKQKWNIVITHAPVFSGAAGRTNAAMRASWQPILAKYDVDLVLSGHDHVYSRGFLAGQPDGTQYVVQVTSPKYYQLAPAASNDWSGNGATRVAAAARTSSYGVLSFSGDTLRYDSVIASKSSGSTASGPVGSNLDSFTITKHADGSKSVR